MNAQVTPTTETEAQTTLRLNILDTMLALKRVQAWADAHPEVPVYAVEGVCGRFNIAGWRMDHESPEAIYTALHDGAPDDSIEVRKLAGHDKYMTARSFGGGVVLAYYEPLVAEAAA